MSSAWRAAIYVLPAAAIALAAGAILGPGRARMAVGIKIWGLPAEGGDAIALRIEAARRLLGVEDATALDNLSVSARSGETPLGIWQGETGPDGIAEARLGMPPGASGTVSSPIAVTVRRHEALLLEAELPVRQALPWPFPGAQIPGASGGALQVQVELPRGPLAAPFPGVLQVQIRRSGGEAAAGAQIEATADGADLAGAAFAANETGVAVLDITPRAHVVELSLKATHGSEAGQWEGKLPVVPGAIWLDPRSPGDALRLVSPAPRARAYVSLFGPQGRAQGGVVPLRPDEAGFFTGELTIEPGIDRPLWAVIAGDPYEQGAGTIAWPIGPFARSGEIAGEDAPEAALRVALLADGLPLAEAKERARAARARWMGLAVAASAAVAEALLVLLHARRARRRLAAHLAAMSADDAEGGEPPLPEDDRARLVASARAEPALWALALAALVVFAFAAVAALATFR